MKQIVLPLSGIELKVKDSVDYADDGIVDCVNLHTALLIGTYRYDSDPQRYDLGRINDMGKGELEEFLVSEGFKLNSWGKTFGYRRGDHLVLRTYTQAGTDNVFHSRAHEEAEVLQILGRDDLIQEYLGSAETRPVWDKLDKEQRCSVFAQQVYANTYEVDSIKPVKSHGSEIRSRKLRNMWVHVVV